MLQLDSPVLKSHLKRRLSLLEVTLSLATTVDILVGSVLPNLDFVEIGFCFLDAGLVVGLVVRRVVMVGLVVVLLAGRVAGLPVVRVVGLVVLLVKTGAGAPVVVEGCFLCGARGTLGLARVVLETPPLETVKVK